MTNAGGNIGAENIDEQGKITFPDLLTPATFYYVPMAIYSRMVYNVIRKQVKRWMH